MLRGRHGGCIMPILKLVLIVLLIFVAIRVFLHGWSELEIMLGSLWAPLSNFLNWVWSWLRTLLVRLLDSIRGVV